MNMVKTALFVTAKRENVSVLILNQTRLLSHSLKHASFSPIHNSQIYTYSKINSRLLATISSISPEQYLIDAVYHHTHTSTLPKVGLELPWSTNAMSWL